MLTDDEIVRLAGIFLDLGVRTIRLTGGEPLVRAGVAGLLGRLAAPATATGTVADHQRDRAGRQGGRAGRRPAWTG